MASIRAVDGEGNPLPQPNREQATRPTTEMPPAAGDTPKIRVRAKNDFWSENELRRTGEEFEMDATKARHAAMFLEVITSDGRQISVEQAVRNMLGDANVSRADVAGRPTHERVQALEDEEQALKSRLEAVGRQLELERGRLQTEQDNRQQRQSEMDEQRQRQQEIVQKTREEKSAREQGEGQPPAPPAEGQPPAASSNRPDVEFHSK